MPQRRRVARAAVSAAAATACLALASPAWAAAVSLAPGSGHNPPGSNGTVKIDGTPFEDKVDNQPHVTCEFELEFFNFDKGETADITLAGQPPSSSDFRTVKFLDNYVISNDPASGAENDHDEVIRFSANDLALAGLTPHPKQGYHVKLTVELNKSKGAGKHKVFWIQPCGTTPSESPGTDTGQESASPTTSPTAGGGAGGGTGGELALTGAAATTLALVGVGLIGGGVALVVLRRRRDNITFTS